MTTDDIELVRQYAAHRSESAFSTLVSRHANLVYSVALRQVGNPQLAEEITQAVFIILARKAESLSAKTILPGWLYRAACYASSGARKQEHRRQRHEQEAYMESTLQAVEADAAWKQLSPLLEEAMLRLGQADRDALVLRFFEGRSLNEVGAALGASEDAAKKRVMRALEKLRKYFTKRGVSSTTAILAGAITANSVQAAPAALAKTATAVALVKGATASTSTITLIKGALKLMAWTKTKITAVAAAAVILAVGTPIVVHVVHQQREETTLFNLKYISADDAVRALSDLLADTPKTRLIADEKANSILVKGPPESQEIVRQVLQKLDKPAPDAPDISTPKKAALAFANAVAAGDLDAAKKAATGTDAEWNVVKMMSDAMVAAKEFNAALLVEFGYKEDLVPGMNMDPAPQLKSAEEKIDGDKAILVIKSKPDDPYPPTFKKTAAGWVMDLGNMEKDPSTVQMVQALPVMTKSLNTLTADIKNGKYKSVEEAMSAFQQLTKASGIESAPGQ